MPQTPGKEMLVADLRKELADRGLDTKGLKAELVERLDSAKAAESKPPTKTPRRAATTPSKKSADEAPLDRTEAVVRAGQPASPPPDLVAAAGAVTSAPTNRSPAVAAAAAAAVNSATATQTAAGPDWLAYAGTVLLLAPSVASLYPTCDNLC